MATGTIKTKTDKGFGFIKVADGPDVFFHSTGCLVPFDSLNVGDTVTFDMGMGPKGPKAENVNLSGAGVMPAGSEMNAEDPFSAATAA